MNVTVAIERGGTTATGTIAIPDGLSPVDLIRHSSAAARLFINLYDLYFGEEPPCTAMSPATDEFDRWDGPLP